MKLLYLFIFLAFGMVAQASTPITVTNPSFEDAGVPFGEIDTLGWDSIYGLWTTDLDGGENLGDWTLNEGSVNMEGFGQDLGIVISPNTTYTVTYDFMLSWSGDEGGNNVTSTVTFYSRDVNGVRTDRGSISTSHPPEDYVWQLDNTASFTFYSGAPGVGEELGIWFSYSGIKPWAGFDYIRAESNVSGSLPPNPLFRKQPVPVTAASGSTVEFSVMAVNASSYAWKKQGSSQVLSTSATLILHNIAESNEGYYYCQATNSHGTTVSESARLLTNRLMGHWEFEGNLTDNIAGKNGNDVNDSGTPGTADYNTGIVGAQALELAADGFHIEIPDAGYFAFYPQSYTATFWIKTQAETGAVISNYNWDTGGWTLGAGTVAWSNLIGNNFGETISYNIEDVTPVLNDNEWHFVTGTYDSASKVFKLYVDGELAGTIAVSANQVPVTDELLIFGDNASVEDPYEGLLDDVKIYSYAMTPQQVATEYLAVKPSGEVCIDYPKYDVNGDCIVNMIDFAAFANNWLTDTIIP